MDWIRHAETKAVGVLVSVGVFVGLSGNTEMAVSFISPRWSPLLSWLPIALSGVAVVFAGLTLSPVMGVKKANRSLIYFHDVSGSYPGTSNDFVSALRRKSRKRDPMADEVMEQIWALSHVADKKFRRCRRAVWWFVASVISVLVETAIARLW